ncbi:MAG: hypothetical protein ABSF94_17340 [Steroidobacteraceae bacterium]|jgi:hypothetical protein
MSSERPEEFSQPSASSGPQTAGDHRGSADDSAHQETTVLVRGETIRDQDKSPRKEVSEAKVKMQNRLPALDDDADVGVTKEQIVIRDGKADLAFNGKLLASAAPSSAPKGQWQEYRIYETHGGLHVFSKVTRSVFMGDQDTHVAEVFDPSPSSVPSQLLRSARDLARSRPMTWMDAAAAFFGYDPLAKALYRKVSGQFEERIS